MLSGAAWEMRRTSVVFLLIFLSLEASALPETQQEHEAGQGHACRRECSPSDNPRVCYYHFILEWYNTLGRACFDCPFNTSDCKRPECVAADGSRRAIVTVNRLLPGPSIEVCRGDTIMVDVENGLGAETTTIHWHGIHQYRTAHMDGVPMVTQCPIQPDTTFRYEFVAKVAGTYYWHSHSGLQRADGAFGPLIVRQNDMQEPHLDLYDFDLSEHVILITDWFDVVGVQKMTSHFFNGGDNKPSSLLVNGKGRYAAFGNDTHPVFTPVEVFSVHKDSRYRFRLISNGVLNCPVVVSIDNHTLTIIATDGSPVAPFAADSLVVYAGERFDFVLDANESVDNYWIRMQGLMDCDERFTSVKQVAILRYDGAPNEEPLGKTDYFSMARNGTQLNPLNSATNGSLVSVTDLDSLLSDEGANSVRGTPDVQFHLGFDFSYIDSRLYHNPSYYPIHLFDHHHRIYLPQVNNITLRFPSSPLLTQPEDVPRDMFCNATSRARAGCSSHQCQCLHALRVPLGALVELVMVDTGVFYDANHPIHLHGTGFRVVAMGRLGNKVTVEQVKQLDQSGNITRKLSKAVLKDTVTIPDGGYTIVRFRAINPGYWLLHCHIAFHMEMGMAVILKVGDRRDFPPAPLNFPKCGNWLPPPTLVTSAASRLVQWQNGLVTGLVLAIIIHWLLNQRRT